MRRVVVTGIGVISPVGNDKETTWKNLLEGKSGVEKITRFNADDFGIKIAGEVRNFNPIEHGIDEKESKRLDLFSQFALAASIAAVKDCGIDLESFDKERGGVSIGVGLGGLHTLEEEHSKYLEKGPRRISPFFVPMMIANLGPGNVSIKYGLKGPQFCPVAACASGTYGIIEGYRAIKDGLADFMVSGGSESCISPMGVGGFVNMKALTGRNDDPHAASRPFDKDRDGFVPAEGSGILILEELEHAKKRNARIYAEVVGFGFSSDAFHITQPAPEGEGGYRAMKNALKSANLKPEDINYINAHGTSTPFNDKLETLAIKNLFGEHAKKIKVNSTKSMTGHLLGAAGGLEGAVMALSIYYGKLHPTINLDNPDPECDLDYVPNKAQDFEVKYALSNSFGFGGVNGVVAFGKYTG